jgi:hypothetical protein
MKNLRFVFLAAIFSLAAINLASGGELTKRYKTVEMDFERAFFNYELAKSMYLQLHDKPLDSEIPVYVFRVFHQDKIYMIKGSYHQWKDFFDAWGGPSRQQWWPQSKKGAVSRKAI